MKLIIAGSRDINISIEKLDEIIKSNFTEPITEIVSGCAKGVDQKGIEWANKNNIPVKEFRPDWSIGKSAGHVRNRQMGDYADQALVIYNGSNGSQGMIDYMKKINKYCKILLICSVDNISPVV